MATLGLYGKVWDYLIKFWNVNSLMALGLALCFCIVISHTVEEKVKERIKYKQNGIIEDYLNKIKHFISNIFGYNKKSKSKFTI